MDDLTNEMLATAIKYLSAKRHNFYESVNGDYSLDREQYDHINGEIDKLNLVIGVLEHERDVRRMSVAS